MPQALRSAGIVERLGAGDSGVVPAPPYEEEWSPGSGVRNGPAIARFSLALADHLEPILRGAQLPLVLGGDCSILLGPMLALRRMGRYGLIFTDGHLDFRHPGNAIHVGAAAGEDLALVTGRGNPLLADLEGLGPLVQDHDVVAFAFREGPMEAEATDILDTKIELVGLDLARSQGIEVATGAAIDRLRANRVQGIWVHVDVDVLDSDLMPAVDSPAPGGLSFEELEGFLRVVRAAPLIVGLELTVFDPDLDSEGVLARRLVDAVVAGLA